MKTIEQIRAAFNGSLLNIPAFSVTLPDLCNPAVNIPQCYWSNPIPGWDAPAKIAPQGLPALAGIPGFIYSSTSDTGYLTDPFHVPYVPEYLRLEKIKQDCIDQVHIGSLPYVQNKLPAHTLPNGDYLCDPHAMRVKRLRRTVRNAANSHTEELQTTKSRYTAHFITLTYGDVDWSPSHITAYIKAARAYFERKKIKFRYTWVAEIQEKRAARTGAHGVHYHIVLWLPKGVSVPKADKRGWWKHGMSNTKKARNPTAYLMKYVSKGTRFPFPKGLRTHGTGGLTKDSRLKVAWWNIPKYVRDQLGDYTARIARGVRGVGGWLSRLTGEWMPSQYKIIQVSPLIIRRLPC